LFKSVHIYRSYRQNKPGSPFFGTHGRSSGIQILGMDQAQINYCEIITMVTPKFHKNVGHK